MNFITMESDQKLRGGYCTPIDIAQFITNWISEINPDLILEPSCGDGAFLEALDYSLQLKEMESSKILAIEYDEVEAKKAKVLSENLASDITVINDDYLSWAISNLEDHTKICAVIGNPPFIRYQYLPDSMQEEASVIFDFLNTKFTRHTNAWVPFVLSAIHFLKPGGRLGMVLPSEILHVMYAQSLRSYIGDNCKYAMIFDPEDLWFENTLQGAIILMIEKKNKLYEKSLGLGIKKTKGRDFLKTKASDHFKKMLFRNGDTIKGKWTYALLSDEEFTLYKKLADNNKIHFFHDIARVDVGIVTGANKFFLVPDDVVKEYNLEKFSHPMFGRSDHCPGIVYDDIQHKENSKKKLPNNFLYFDIEDVTELNTRQVEYIHYGENQDLHERYKCRIRKLWFKVPSIYSTDIGLMKRCHDFPKLILNRKRAFTTDTSYRIRMKESDNTNEDFVCSFINSLTALSAELEGRHYGGGVLELVPTEIERLLIPVVHTEPKDLKKLNEMVRAESYSVILKKQDEKILKKCGLTSHEIQVIEGAWYKLRNRRQRKS